jgi:hypothetical protein
VLAKFSCAAASWWITLAASDLMAGRFRIAARLPTRIQESAHVGAFP